MGKYFAKGVNLFLSFKKGILIAPDCMQTFTAIKSIIFATRSHYAINVIMTIFPF